ncbi:hypothetical protein EDB80DRAFT_271103 [Ilyonectria destructans]|nr:hypothetical protein EDB80DRAFT_271103 [Ilyonectria destructans]
MAQPTEGDILAALSRYRARITEATHRAMLAIIPVVEEAHLEKTSSRVSAEEEEERRFNYLDRLIALPRGNTKPPIERPSDVLKHWDLIAQQVSLDGTTVNADLEYRNAKRKMYRSAILEGLGHLECPTGQWMFPLDFEILMRHVDGLEGHGWAMLRDVTERLVFFVGWGTEGVNETHELIQERVMTGEDILEETAELHGHNNYEIAGGWLSGYGGESGVYVVYSRPTGDDIGDDIGDDMGDDTGDESQGWAWRYIVSQGQFGIDFFDNIVAVLDWYKEQGEPLEIEIGVTAKDVFSH